MAIDTSEPIPHEPVAADDGSGRPAHTRTRTLIGHLRASPVRCWLDGGLVFVVRAATILLVGVFAAHGLGPLPHANAVSLVPGSRALFTNFFHYDAVRYVQIAQHGYTHRYDTVYFPLYPLLVRLLPLRATYAALVISWIAAYLFVVTLTYYVRTCLGFKRWSGVVLMAAFAPASFFFFCAYPESIEALGLTLVLVLVHKGRLLPAAAVAAVATASAPICALFVIPIAVALVRRRAWVLAVVAIPLSELGIVAYGAWLWARFGSPLLFWSEEATPQWNRKITYPFHGVVWSLDRMLHGQLIGAPAFNGAFDVADLVNDVVAVAGAVAVITLVVLVWRRRTSRPLVPGVALAAAAVAFNVCDATAGGVSPEALARHLLVIVPLYLVVAFVRRVEVTMYLLAGSVVLAVIAQTLYFHGLWFT